MDSCKKLQTVCVGLCCCCAVCRNIPAAYLIAAPWTHPSLTHAAKVIFTYLIYNIEMKTIKIFLTEIILIDSQLLIWPDMGQKTIILLNNCCFVLFRASFIGNLEIEKLELKLFYYLENH